MEKIITKELKQKMFYESLKRYFENNKQELFAYNLLSDYKSANIEIYGNDDLCVMEFDIQKCNFNPGETTYNTIKMRVDYIVTDNFIKWKTFRELTWKSLYKENEDGSYSVNE